MHEQHAKSCAQNSLIVSTTFDMSVSVTEATFTLKFLYFSMADCSRLPKNNRVHLQLVEVEITKEIGQIACKRRVDSVKQEQKIKKGPFLEMPALWSIFVKKFQFLEGGINRQFSWSKSSFLCHKRGQLRQKHIDCASITWLSPIQLQ